ncbi:conserved unknown protein [Ectocarpus siliculosus]|uniref:Sulfotransferase domain-containing protein n=1 Tax=Ectocarpus siliculosus TaxID=2880 RepID=D7G3W4_ECTSI|nr:conserved unknown protein [Ectocarpus siliculosus]|eukprot:CBJ33641.1 conserved unknown protein [Ectocarpus siliculosus]
MQVSSNATHGKVTVESSPRYIFNPLAPYRMGMVQPFARLVLVLRDPTDRYFSQLRMTMCSGKTNQTFERVQENQATWFHSPGDAAGYIDGGEATYEPYTPLCRGENATTEDLRDCYRAQLPHHPLLRGLYADQLERWFRVFDKSQILIVDSANMMEDLPGVLADVAAHIGLPGSDFDSDRPVQHSTGLCPALGRGEDPDFFGEEGRYDKMLEEEDLFREWYRPHNERLFKLLGRSMMWD